MNPSIDSVPSTTNQERPIQANDFRQQWQQVRELVLLAVERVGKSGWLVLGKEVLEFEKQFARLIGCEQAVGCASGLDAIEIALRSLGLKKGQLVLTSPLSAFATTLAILRAGAIPVFSDTDSTGQIDLDKASSVFDQNPSIRFFVPVHLYGHCLDLEKLAEIKKRFRLRVVEDCAQSVGATHGEDKAGTVGQAAAFSFYPTKNLGAYGDAGCILSSEEEVVTKARALRNYGEQSKYVHTEFGMNSRLDELQAAILRTAILPQLERFNRRRKDIASKYQRGIDHPNITVPRALAKTQSVWHLFPLLCTQRDSLQAYLLKNNIHSAVHYPTLIPDQPVMSDWTSYNIDRLDRARAFAHQELSLPIHPFLTDQQIDQVIQVCNRWKP